LALAGLLILIFVSSELAIRSVSYPKECSTQEEAESNRGNQAPEKPFWCLSGWATADWLTLALVVIGAMQTGVFFEQARRLRETIDKMDEVSRGQTADMAKSIAEAARAANAMNDVAAAAAQANVISRDAIAAAERPWLKIDPVISSGITYEKSNGGTLRLGFTIIATNLGRGPAIKVNLLCVKLLVQSFLEPVGPKEEQKRLSEKAKNWNGPNQGVIFPQQKLEFRYLLGVSSDELTRVTAEVPFARLKITGVADYQNAFDGKRHQTWYSAEVQIPRSDTLHTGVRRDEGDIPIDRLTLIVDDWMGHYGD
jgi:hypothetical protein